VEVAWRIAPDGGVSGQVGGRAVEGGRMRNDRSWFGRLMHWRQPYAIDGQGFCAGIILRTGEMDGTLTVGGAPYRLTLRKQ